MTQDSLKPQCGTCPSSPPLAFSSLSVGREGIPCFDCFFLFPKECSCFLMPRPGLVVRNCRLSLPPLCSKLCEIRRCSSLPHPETALCHFCCRDSSLAMALQNRLEPSRKNVGRGRRPHQKYLPATKTLLLPSAPNEVYKNVRNSRAF